MTGGALGLKKGLGLGLRGYLDVAGGGHPGVLLEVDAHGQRVPYSRGATDSNGHHSPRIDPWSSEEVVRDALPCVRFDH